MFKKLSKILIPLTMLAGIGFATTTFTSCSVLSSTKGLMFKQYGTETDLNSDAGKSISSFANSKSSLDKLFYGTKSVNKGNYVMFFGADTIADGAEWTNDTYLPQYNSSLYRLLCSNEPVNGQNPNWDSPWTMDADQDHTVLANIKNVTGLVEGKDDHYWNVQPQYNFKTSKWTKFVNKVNFYSFIDKSPLNYYGEKAADSQNPIPQPVSHYYSPFYKWQDADYNGKGFTKYADPNYNYWHYSHNPKEYARYDTAAVNYRKVMGRLNLLMPSVFTTATQDKLIGVAWVNGVPSSHTFDGDSVIAGAQGLTDWLDTVYSATPLK